MRPYRWQDPAPAAAPTMPIAGHHYAEAPARHTWRDEGACEGCAFEWDGIACIEAHPAARIAFGGDCLQRGVIYIAAPARAIGPQTEPAPAGPAPTSSSSADHQQRTSPASQVTAGGGFYPLRPAHINRPLICAKAGPFPAGLSAGGGLLCKGLRAHDMQHLSFAQIDQP